MNMQSVPGAKLHPARPSIVEVPGPVTGDDFERLQNEIKAISSGHRPSTIDEGVSDFDTGGPGDPTSDVNEQVASEVARVQPTDLQRVKETAVTMLANLHAKATVREDQYEHARADLVHARAVNRTNLVQHYRRAMEAVKAEALAALEAFDKGDGSVLAIRDLDAANQRARDEDDRLQAILRTMKDG